MSTYLNTEALVAGQRYRVHYQDPSQRLQREVIADYAGINWTGNTMWSLRPRGGDVLIPTDWIRSLWITQAEIQLPTPVRAEQRVY